MSLIDGIRVKVNGDRFEFSQHALDQSLARPIDVAEIRAAISVAEVIEDYPDDKYGPSCLLFGTTPAGRPLHIQCSYPFRTLLKIITVYEPDASVWTNHRERKKP